MSPAGALIASVTHPDMHWTGHEMKCTAAFILSERADIHHHRLDDHLGAIAAAGLDLDAIRELPVDERIAHLLTPGSFARVRGRHQVLVFRATRVA